MTNWDDFWRADDATAMLDIGPSTRSRLRLMLPLIEKYARPGGSLLDVGCGTGGLLAQAVERVSLSRVWGMDLSPLPLPRARAACPSAQLVTGDICAAPLAERFDLITCMMTLDLVPDEASAARHMAEMLASGGHLIVVVQHLEKYRSALDDRYSVRRHDVSSLRRLFAASGLEPVESFSWGWPLFDAYYRVMDRSGAGVVASSNAPSQFRRLLSWGVYNALRLDDLFRPLDKGRVLFGVFHRPHGGAR